MIRSGIVVHGGVGSPLSLKGGCTEAVKKGRAVLARKGTALDAVVEAVVSLEDDGRFNAGSGAYLRLDGKTIEMDAALMDSTGTLGSVACISRVKNPVRVAREVAKTPHTFLCGEGAVGFARRRGFPDHYQPSPSSVQRHAEVKKLLREKKFEELREAWKNFDLPSNWNFETPYDEVFSSLGCDTVGAVALAEDGTLAAAVSTGGVSVMLRGRIGDSPLIGCGFYAGTSGAVVATGIGEEITRRLLSRQVHDWIAQGEEVRVACERGLALFPAAVPVGLIAISRRGTAAVGNREMATDEDRDGSP